MTDTGWTRTPNFIFELMADMKEAEFKVVMTVLRNTAGWQRERVALSTSELQAITGLSRPSVVAGIKAAMERGILGREPDGDSFAYWLIEPVKNLNQDAEVVKNFNQASKEFLLDEPDTSKEFLPEVVNNFDQQVVKNLYHNKRNIYTKKSKEKEGEGAVAPRAPLTTPRPANVQLVRSGIPTTKQVPLHSRHLQADRFVEGYIPAGAGRNPVEVYYERFCVNLDKARLTTIQEDDLARLCPDLERLRETVIAYSQTSYRPGNIKLILDWYREGIPSRSPHKENHRASNWRGSAADSARDETPAVSAEDEQYYRDFFRRQALERKAALATH